MGVLQANECSLARVQPALKHAMGKGAHIATLAGTLHQAPPLKVATKDTGHPQISWEFRRV